MYPSIGEIPGLSWVPKSQKVKICQKVGKISLFGSIFSSKNMKPGWWKIRILSRNEKLPEKSRFWPLLTLKESENFKYHSKLVRGLLGLPPISQT